MSRKKFSIILVSFVLVASMLLTSCGSKDEKSVDGKPASEVKDGKFVPPITLRSFSFVGPQVKYTEGESYENNIWTRAYEEQLGIKLKFDFVVPDFSTFDIKVMGALASNNLPDIMPVYTTLFFRIADAGKLKDLKEAYEKYLNPELKVAMTRLNGRALNTCTRNGILAAIASPPTVESAILWIRQDWLDKLNLSGPTTMNDVINIAKAFTSKDPDGNGEDDTYGMAIDKNLHGLNGFANGFHAYKDIWVEQADGTLGRGEIQPVWKTVLGKLNELFKAGVLDPEFTSKDSEELKKDYAAERQGMVFGGHTNPDGGLNMAVEANPDARWSMFTLPSSDDQPALGQSPSRISNFVAMNKNCPYPEAIMMLANLSSDIGKKTEPEYQAYHDFVDKDGNHIDSFFYPLISIINTEPNSYYKMVQKIKKALVDGDLSALNAEGKGYYKRLKPFIEETDPEKKALGFRMYAIFGPGGSIEKRQEILDKKLLYSDRGWGPETEAWKNFGPDLFNKSLEYFSRIILDDISLEDGWKEWTDYFNANGGKQATDEINQWWIKEGKAGFSEE